jgi:hypothetical protein
VVVVDVVVVLVVVVLVVVVLVVVVVLGGGPFWSVIVSRTLPSERIISSLSEPPSTPTRA